MTKLPTMRGPVIAKMTGEQQIADELRAIASELDCGQRQMHLEIAAQIVEQGQFAHPDTFGMQIMFVEVLNVLDKYADELCEGWCEKSPDCAHFVDCGGCLARRTAFQVRGETE